MNLLKTEEDVEMYLLGNLDVLQTFVKWKAPASANRMDIEDAVMVTIEEYLKSKEYFDDIPMNPNQLTGIILKRSTQHLTKILRKSRLAKGIGCGKVHKKRSEYLDSLSEKLIEPIDTLDRDGTKRKGVNVENLSALNDAASRCIKKDETRALQSLLGDVVGLGSVSTRRICTVYYQYLLCKEGERVTISEVALQCGVSQQAVSKALRKLGELILAEHPHLFTEFKTIKCA